MQTLQRKFPTFFKCILGKIQATKIVGVLSILPAKPKPFCIPLLYAEPFAFLIKLSKHRPPTGFALLPEILKPSATVLAWKSMDLVHRNLRLATKWNVEKYLWRSYDEDLACWNIFTECIFEAIKGHFCTIFIVYYGFNNPTFITLKTICLRQPWKAINQE